MAKLTKFIWVSPETWKLCKLASIRDGEIDKALSNAIVEMFEKEALHDFEFERSEEKKALKVSEETWYLVDRFKRELGFKTADEFVFSVVASYLISLGVSKACLMNLLETL